MNQILDKILVTTDTAPGFRVTTNRYIRVRPIQSAWSIPEGMPRLFYLLWAPFKVIFIGCQLVWLMGAITQCPNYIFVQVKKKINGRNS